MRPLFPIIALFVLVGCVPTLPDGVADTPSYRRCISGDVSGCVEHGQAMEPKGPAGKRTALISYQFACHQKNAEGCAGLARILGRTSGDQKQKAFKAMEAACDGGVMESCVELADQLRRNQAIPLYRKACDADDGRACARLADKLRDKWRLQDQLKEAFRYSEKACDLGEPEGCVAVGQALLFGSGVAKDPERGVALLTGTCTSEIGLGCTRLAQIYEQGVGLPPDLAMADKYYELAATHNPDAVVADSPQSAYLVYVDGCNNGDVLGCFNSAWSLAEGIDVDRNISTSRELFQQACQSGLDAACERWEEIPPAAEVIGANP